MFKRLGRYPQQLFCNLCCRGFSEFKLIAFVTVQLVEGGHEFLHANQQTSEDFSAPLGAPMRQKTMIFLASAAFAK